MAENTMESHALNQGSTFVWHELYTADPEGSINFYSNCLGFGRESMEMGEGFTYHMLTKNGQSVCGVMGTNTPEMANTPPHWSTYIAVDDVDARLAKCVEAGAKVVVPAMDVPTVGRMVLIEDPFGAHVWLFRSNG